MSEQTNIEDDGNGTEDSSVIRELRAQLKAAQKAQEANAELASSFSQAKREAIQVLIDRPGSPKLIDVVSDMVDGFPTPEKVQAVLADLGLAEVQTPTPTEEPSTPTAPSVQQVAGLGQRAANAASAGVAPTVDERLAKAESPEEIEAIMNEAWATA